MRPFALFVLFTTLGFSAASTAAETNAPPTLQRFVVEREIPGAGKMTPVELRDAAAKSNKVVRDLGPDIHWVQSYVTGDKLYCIYEAPSAKLIQQHAERSGFPASRISPVTAVIDPTTASAK